MKRKKSILGIGLYILYGILLLGTIAWILYTGAVSAPLSCVAPVLGIIGVLLAVFFLKRIARCIEVSKKSKVFLEVACAIGLLAAVIFFGTQSFWPAVSLAQQSAYFTLASVRPDAAIPSFDSNMAMFYTYLISFLLSLFGNKAAVCVIFQIVLWGLGVFFCYLAARNINGVCTAVLTAGALIFSPIFRQKLYPLGPDILFFVFCMLLFYALSVLWRKNAKGNYVTGFSIAIFAAVGMINGLLAAADWYAVIFLPIALVGIVLWNPKENKRICAAALTKSILYFSGCILGFLLPLLPDGNVYQIFPDLQWSAVSAIGFLLPFSDRNLSVIFLAAAGIWMFSYWKLEKEEAIPYILLLIGSTVAFLLLPNGLSYELFIGLSWCLLAASAVPSFIAHQRIPAQAAIETAEAVTETKQQEPPVCYIPNPLPLPKKHVKKEMDYAFVPEEDKMHFDIEHLKENDDFEV